MKIKYTIFCLLFAICTNMHNKVRAQAVNVQDSLALVDLYNSTDGPGWINHDNWLTGPVTTWYGITVSDTRVTEISLPYNSLIGSIPFSLGNITNLNYLNLQSNGLKNGIPFSFGNLVNLSYLNLVTNQLSGHIPSSLGNLTNLTVLFLQENQLSGSIPSSLGNLSNLSGLYLQENQLSGGIPSSLGNLSNLNVLYLSRNKLSGSIPPELGNLVNLHYLFADHNKLSGNISLAITNLFFSSLDLSYNNFTFTGIELIAEKFPGAIYSNQARIPVYQKSDSLSVSAGGTLSKNTYKWYRIKKTGTAIITSIKGDSVFHPLQSGVYFARVTNSTATQLILHSDTINYMATDAAINTSYTNALQLKDKAKIFIVYPNPVKNILYVHIKGKANISLTDQSGKIIIIKAINNTGEINVSHLPAGLYYLKNDETGVVQKVIIAK